MFHSFTTIGLFVLLGFGSALGAIEPGWVYLDNGEVRIGVNTNAGGCIGFFGESKTQRNLLNHYDEGRFLQQSWYGDRDGSKWNEKPWVWNPVQGGSWDGKPAKLLSISQSKDRLIVKGYPRHWAAGQLLTNVVMESEIRLTNRIAVMRFRMVYHGKKRHRPRSQEMPAVFIDAALTNFVYYRGNSPWSGDKLHRVVPTWPNQHDELPESWAAYVDDRDWGIGVFSPGHTRMTFYRFGGPVGPNGSGCSYFAPVTKAAIEPGFDHEYFVFMTVGKLSEIRKRFHTLSR